MKISIREIKAAKGKSGTILEVRSIVDGVPMVSRRAFGVGQSVADVVADVLKELDTPLDLKEKK